MPLDPTPGAGDDPDKTTGNLRCLSNRAISRPAVEMGQHDPPLPRQFQSS